MESDNTSHLVSLDKKDIEVLCESMWHSLQRADVPPEDTDRIYQLRDRLISLPEFEEGED